MNHKQDLYSSHDYREYLRADIEANGHIRRYRLSLAEAAGCQLSYLSQVLHSHVELTPDHAARLAVHWNLDDDATEYFMALVGHSRAGAKELREWFDRKLATLRRKHEKITRRIGPVPTLETDHRAAYYSAWYLSAIHVLLLIPQFRKVVAIASKLRLDPALVQSGLVALEGMGLARRRGEGWLATEKNLHLSPDSPFTAIQHCNWRNRTVLQLQERHGEGLHYTGVHALKRQDIDRIKALLLDTIERAREIIGPSPEEDLVCLAVDFYGL